MAQPAMENKKSYDFEVYTPAILGTGFKNIEILGYFPYESAIIFQPDLAPIHAEIYSTGKLPVGSPNDPRQYQYYRIKKPDGSTTMLGEIWINQTSIVEVESGTAFCTVPGATTTDIIRLQDMFKQAGFVNVEIKFSN
jgi:hypothetical protein